MAKAVQEIAHLHRQIEQLQQAQSQIQEQQQTADPVQVPAEQQRPDSSQGSQSSPPVEWLNSPDKRANSRGEQVPDDADKVLVDMQDKLKEAKKSVSELKASGQVVREK